MIKINKKIKCYITKSVSMLLVIVTFLSLFTWMPFQASAAATSATPTVYSQLSDTSAYNYPGGSGSTYKSSGCGVYAVVNAVKYLTGEKIDPHELGEFAISCGARVNGGTLGATLCKKAAASDKFGGAYGFSLTETYTFGSSDRTMRCDIGGKKTASGYPSTSEWDVLYSKLVSHLEDGEVAVVLVMGHYMAIVDYDNSTGKFLMLDSAAYTSKRLSQNNGKWQWVTADQLNYNKAPKANSSYNNQGPYIHLRSEIMFLAKVGGSSNNNTTQSSTNPDSYPVLDRDLVYKSGSAVKTGNDVKWLQTVLLHLGYSISIDGSYGPSSRDVVKKFQSAYGLTSDGMAGPNTRAKLKELWSSKGHTWGNATIVTAASHTTTGTKTYKCNYCEATKSEAIPAQGHSYGSWQNHNSTQHKKTCSCGDVQYANHTWNSGTITKGATHIEEGIKTYTCTGCNATKTEAIAKLSGHTYGAWLNYDGTQHKRVCACGSYELFNHSWDNGVITTTATNTTEGIKTYTCSTCNATKIEKLPVLVANHEWDDGVITHTSLCTGEGIKTYTCVKCGETKEVTINFTTHTFKGWQNYNDTQHIRECACGDTQEIGDHIWDTVLVTKNPTCSETGIETHYCTTCGTSKTVELSMLSHEWDDGVISTPASTTQDGVKTFECVNCNASKTEKIPKLDVSESCPLITVSDYEAMAGGTVTVTVALKNNPGIASLILKVAYDHRLLTLTNVQYNNALGGQTIAPVDFNSPVTLYWINEFADMSNDTVFATLTFKVNDDATVGNSSDIVISYNANDIYNINEENIEFTIQNGTITVSDYLPGDINGDGELNNKDVTRLMQYFADWEVEVNEAALDVNGDGTLNNKDVSRLIQYLAGWNVDIY